MAREELSIKGVAVIWHEATISDDDKKAIARYLMRKYGIRPGKAILLTEEITDAFYAYDKATSIDRW